VKPVTAAERGEHWWPVALAILATAGLHAALPAQYRVQPRFVVPVVLLALLAVLIIGDPGRIDRQKPWLRIVTGIVIAFITVANLFAAARLVADILYQQQVLRQQRHRAARSAGGGTAPVEVPVPQPERDHVRRPDHPAGRADVPACAARWPCPAGGRLVS
jgi:hypothetical protein